MRLLNKAVFLVGLYAGVIVLLSQKIVSYTVRHPVYFLVWLLIFVAVTAVFELIGFNQSVEVIERAAIIK